MQSNTASLTTIHHRTTATHQHCRTPLHTDVTLALALSRSVSFQPFYGRVDAFVLSGYWDGGKGLRVANAGAELAVEQCRPPLVESISRTLVPAGAPAGRLRLVVPGLSPSTLGRSHDFPYPNSDEPLAYPYKNLIARNSPNTASDLASHATNALMNLRLLSTPSDQDYPEKETPVYTLATCVQKCRTVHHPLIVAGSPLLLI
ncbi:hypothetical protein BASA62_004807 [Batrachochytrium salamandrivorans]|nr:hypothetical protein BASA62_004807 [Batrachochytrium salamandrivorans]